MNESELRELTESMRLTYINSVEKFVEDITDVYGRIASAEKRLEHAYIMRDILQVEIERHQIDMVPGVKYGEPGAPPTMLLYAHAVRTMENTMKRASLLETEIRHLKGVVENITTELQQEKVGEI